MEEKKHFVEIAGAVYKILDFFPDGDPLKNRAKEKVIVILENLTHISKSNSGGWILLKTYLSPDAKKRLGELASDLEILEQYLTLGKNQGWVNHMNFLIIVKELSRLKDQVNELQRVLAIAPITVKDDSSTPVSGQRSFAVSTQSKNAALEQPSIGEISERQVKIINILSKREKAQVSDIIKELPSVTKRTIRRDIDDLLKRGKIQREGEWNQVFYKIIS